MKRFEINKVYSMSSPCQQSCTWSYKVIGRTAQTITLQAERTGAIKKCRVSVDCDEEMARPLGRYSMCPVLRAN